MVVNLSVICRFEGVEEVRHQEAEIHRQDELVGRCRLGVWVEGSKQSTSHCKAKEMVDPA